MLVLSRKVGEEIIVDEHIKVVLLESYRGGARIGIEADGLGIRRGELAPLPNPEGPEAGDAHAR